MFMYQPPQPDRKIKRLQDRSAGRVAEGTIEYLSRGGLPVNPVLLNSIKHKLKAGAYRDNRSTLISEVKADPSLYLYSAKHIHRFIEDDGGARLPEEGLRSISEENLVSLFDVTEADVSIHRVRDMSPSQALRLQHAIISSRTAETFAEHADIKPDLAYTTASLRQLGLNLIAWNYPQQYAKALRTQKKGQGTIEQELERLLGIAPLDIARRLAAQWKLAPEIRRGLEEQTIDDTRSEGQSGSAISLKEICNLAELFAKANDVSSYPGAEEAWALAEPVVKQQFGEQVLERIADKVEQSLESLEETSATRFKPNLFTRPEPLSSIPSASRVLLAQNPYLGKTPVSTRKLFEVVYERLNPGSGVSVDALRVLVDSVITQVGFLRGCLYIFDEGSRIIHPALRIGDQPLETYQSFKTHQNNLVTTSLDSTIPVMQTGLSVDGSSRMRMAGGLGAKRPAAVLYLELLPDFFDSSEHDPLLYFHCIRYCFMHCLGMEPATSK